MQRMHETWVGQGAASNPGCGGGLPPVSHPAREQRHEPVRWARAAADTVTFSRLAAGVLLAFWPWEPTTRSLAALFRWKILLWSADAVDGVLARRSRTPPSWIGRQDIWIDCFVALAAAIALTRMGFLPVRFVVGWPATCAVLYILRPVHTVLLVFMLPLHLSVVVAAAIYKLPEFGWFLLWLASLAYLARRRLKWVIADFIQGLPDGPRKWVNSWLPAWLRLTPEERAAFQAFGGDDAQDRRDREVFDV